MPAPIRGRATSRPVRYLRKIVRQTYSTLIYEDGYPRGVVAVEAFPPAILQASGRVAPENEEDLRDMVQIMGLTPGVRLETGDDLANYLYAFAVGRGPDFDEFSSERWGAQRAQAEGQPVAQFAADLVESAVIPTELSPFAGYTLAYFLAHGGVAITVGVAAGLGIPPVGAGVLIGAGGGLVIVETGRLLRVPLRILRLSMYDWLGRPQMNPELPPQIAEELWREYYRRRGDLPPEEPP